MSDGGERGEAGAFRHVSTVILSGECVDTMRRFEPDSIDAIVTDPPYELGFMGKRWDASGIAYSVELWREVLRVAKPGAYLVAFGGTRTSHRMASAIEDAGWEIRDSILAWLYGQGFPKSLDVSKAIDKLAGATREVVGPNPYNVLRPNPPSSELCRQAGWQSMITAPATDAAKLWAGWGTALKPAHEPIIVARKPLAGTVARNFLAHGVGGINVDACRVATAGESFAVPQSDPANRSGEVGRDLGFTSAPVEKMQAAQRASIERTASLGRWPPNVAFVHAPACVDGECAPGCPVAELDAQSGETTSAGARVAGSAIFAGLRAQPEIVTGIGDRGGASRFFPCFTYEALDAVPFLYCAKPGRAERDAGCEDLPPRQGGEATDRVEGSAGLDSPRAGAGRGGGARNFHPTVKPIRLMEWLARLVCPPGGTILDPFLGSGSTGCAAARCGFDFVGIERETEYVEIARRRIALAANTTRTKGIGELVKGPPPDPRQAALVLVEPVVEAPPCFPAGYEPCPLCDLGLAAACTCTNSRIDVDQSLERVSQGETVGPPPACVACSRGEPCEAHDDEPGEVAA